MPYIRALPLKVNGADAKSTFTGKLLALKRRGPKKKSGRGPPTSPTLRPRVLTPRDHFAHRGGGRAMIMHKSNSRCNPNFEKNLRIFRVPATTKIATPAKILSLPKFTLRRAERRTRYCEVRQLPHRRQFLRLSFLESHNR